ncbi:MAG: flippase-like domain-containing protein [Bacteroidales bacterium]|nr:flippase-like domain-containing protein [Bacteroidales bacterium]
MRIYRWARKSLKVILPLLLGLLMVWSLTRKVDWPVVLAELQKGIAWHWVLISIVLALFSHIIRGLRWRLQLRTLGIEPSAHDMAVSVFGNYGLNLALPRVGEIWRCSYVARRYHIPFSTTVGTMVSERLVDMLVAGSMTLLALVHEREHFAQFLAGSDAGQRLLDLLSSWWLWGILAVIAIVLLTAARFLHHTLAYQMVHGFVVNMWAGIKGLKDVPNLWSYLAWSLALWLCYYLNSYTCCFFFGFTEHLDGWAGLAIFVMGSLSLVLPVQGGLGPWHYAVGTALLCYGIGHELSDPQVQAFIWTSWSIEQGFVLLLGLYAMLKVMKS